MRARNSDQLDRLKAILDGMAERVRASVEPSLTSSGADLVAEMQRQAPKGTGALADSIVLTPAGQGTPPNAKGATRVVPDDHVAITAGDEHVFWAAMVEYGTSRAHAQPFFAPAYRSMKSKIAQDFKNAVLDALKDAP